MPNINLCAGNCVVTCDDGSEETYNGCIVATHAPDTLNVLEDQATHDELRILGAFQYVYRYFFWFIVLVIEENVMWTIQWL